MEVTQTAKLTCERCGVFEEFQGQSLERILKCGWLSPLMHGTNGEGQELCSSCAAKEKPDTTSEVAELKARIEKLLKTIEDDFGEAKLLRGIVQQILNKAKSALGKH